MSWGTGEFEARLRRVGRERYHHLHPFNVRMHAGRLSRDEIRTWVRNRYYYQTRIPVKDALILARAEDPAFRREWIRRIHDHDGGAPREGGLELWLRLAEAVGLERESVERLERVLPDVREACDDYVRFVEEHGLLECVAASLTELFAGELMEGRIAAFEEHYPWVDREGLAYFRSRTLQAPRDAGFALGWVLEHAASLEVQERCVAALERKCELLWRLLDAVQAAHVRPRPSPHAQLRPDPQDGRLVVVLPERAVRLNESGREILELCDGVRTADAIAAAVATRHPNAARAEADARGFLARMQRLGVLEPAP